MLFSGIGEMWDMSILRSPTKPAFLSKRRSYPRNREGSMNASTQSWDETNDELRGSFLEDDGGSGVIFGRWPVLMLDGFTSTELHFNPQHVWRHCSRKESRFIKFKRLQRDLLKNPSTRTLDRSASAPCEDDLRTYVRRTRVHSSAMSSSGHWQPDQYGPGLIWTAIAKQYWLRSHCAHILYGQMKSSNRANPLQALVVHALVQIAAHALARSRGTHKRVEILRWRWVDMIQMRKK